TNAISSAGSAISVSGTLTLNASSVLDMVTNSLSGSPTSITGTGTLKTQNTSSTPIPAGKTWLGAVYYNSTSAQTIVDGNYAALDGSGGNRTLSSGGTIGISGTFTPGSGSYTVTGSTVDFNGSGAQTVTAFNYNHLTSSSTGARTLASSGTIGIAGTFTPGTNSYTITGSTIDFNGGTQSVPA